jgi:Flp pilus assembly protein TadG
MRSRQTGITFIGWVVLLVPLAILVFAGIKLAPLYMTQFKVSQALQQTADNSRGDTTISRQVVLQDLERRFDIEGIEDPTLDDILIDKEDDTWVAVVDYTREATLFGGISLLVHFNKRVVLQ